MPPRVTDFLLGPDGDLAIVNGDLGLAADLDGIRQNVETAIRFFLGEWFLDLTLGVPYFQRIFIKSPSLIEIQSYIRDAILSVTGVSEVLAIDVRYIGVRKAAVTWVALTDLGLLDNVTTIVGET